MWKVIKEDELYHHGIKGQKWGVRRFQNLDGTLTAAGRKRYTDENGNPISRQKARKQARERLRTGKTVSKLNEARARYDKADRDLLDTMYDLVDKKQYYTKDLEWDYARLKKDKQYQAAEKARAEAKKSLKEAEDSYDKDAKMATDHIGKKAAGALLGATVGVMMLGLVATDPTVMNFARAGRDAVKDFVYDRSVGKAIDDRFWNDMVSDHPKTVQIGNWYKHR
jgi:F0F1-type ATP synthase assembly protein I